MWQVGGKVGVVVGCRWSFDILSGRVGGKGAGEGCANMAHIDSSACVAIDTKCI